MTKTEEYIGRFFMCGSIVGIITCICALNSWMIDSFSNFTVWFGFVSVWIKSFIDKLFFYNWFRLMPLMGIAASASRTETDTVWFVYIATGLLFGIISNMIDEERK